MPYILILSIHADPAMPPGYDEWGGTHTYMRELLDVLNGKAADSVLITRRAMEELPAVEQYKPHCTIYRLKNGDIAPMDKTRLFEFHDDNLKAIQDIIEARGEPPKVIHSVYWNSGRIGVELAKKYNVPLVHSVISNSLGRQSRGAHEPVKERVKHEQSIYEYSKWILCVSEDEKNDLVKFYHISPDKIIVAGQYIHSSFSVPSRDGNGFPRLNSTISPEAQKSAALKHNDAFDVHTEETYWAYKAFTYFGRIDENKGVDHILAAWCTLYKKYGANCPPLWLIGGSIKEIHTMRAKCQEELSTLRMAERENKVIWWGCIDSSGASTLLLKTLVLVTNSLYEPGGRVITEAMSEGIPIIAAPNGFALDLVRNWHNGFLVEHGNEKDLALRMEHFIRQPYLSNTLGENARETAARVVKQWGFAEKHLWVYGLGSSHDFTDINDQTSCADRFRRREINLFPYRNFPLSNQLLKQFVKEQTGDSSVSVSQRLDAPGTSDIYRAYSKNNNYIIKHPYSRLALSPLVVPIRRREYVRTASDFYNYEVKAYEASGTDALVGKDDFHHLLLLRELDTFSPTLEKYPEIIKYLHTQYTPISCKSMADYNSILHNCNMESIQSIEMLFDELEKAFPDYYFDPSGTFCPYLGWKIAPHMLDYNISAFSEEEAHALQQICSAFSEVCEIPTPLRWHEICSDVSLDHIMLDNGKMCLIDRAKRTIGIAEYLIADFLLDVLLKDTESSSDTSCWKNLLYCIVLEECNCKHILESLSYKLFYETIMKGVLKSGSIHSYIDALDELLNTIAIL